MAIFRFYLCQLILNLLMLLSSGWRIAVFLIGGHGASNLMLTFVPTPPPYTSPPTLPYPTTPTTTIHSIISYHPYLPPPYYHPTPYYPPYSTTPPHPSTPIPTTTLANDYVYIKNWVLFLHAMETIEIPPWGEMACHRCHSEIKSNGANLCM